MAKPLFTFLFLLGTVSYFAQGFPTKLEKLTWSQNNERADINFLAEVVYFPRERNGSRSTLNIEAGCKCGRKNIERIVGGEDATSGEWCWQAKVMRFLPGNNSSYYLCGGTVINDEYILSAAHCFHRHESDRFYIYLGSHRLYHDDDEVKYEVKSLLVHPEYNELTKANDLGLVRLSKKIKYTRHICSVCLPINKAITGEKCTITGWGALKSGGHATEVLQETVVNIVSQPKCQKEYGFIDASQICAAAPGKDACQGDSGGPMVRQNSNGVWDLVGAVSAGYGCAHPNYAGIYANVFELLPWIEENTEGSHYCSRD